MVAENKLQKLQRRAIMPVQTIETVKSRMKNPVMVLPEALQALLALKKATEKCGVPSKTIDLVQLLASQINGCSACVDIHCRDLKKAGETDDRLFTVAAWRDAPYFTEDERAALALAEAATRLSDRSDPVPDEVWEGATRHYDERALAALITSIAAINAFNRINVTTRAVLDPANWADVEKARSAGRWSADSKPVVGKLSGSDVPYTTIDGGDLAATNCEVAADFYMASLEMSNEKETGNTKILFVAGFGPIADDGKAS
jgi:AhpD family alkylhydroperoxidase